MMKTQPNTSNCIKSAPSLSGLYAITDAQQNHSAQLICDVEQALLGGARIIQYRDKSTEHSKRRDTATQLRKLTQQYDALFIVNDDIQLAKESLADGVHLGRDDHTITSARAQLGPGSIIGVSCYNDYALAQQAASNGADYIAFGRFFPSHTKPDAVPADIELLHRARRELNTPIVAIGGITADNAEILLHAGADMLAVVNDIFSQADIKTATQRYQTLFASAHKKEST
jgi:thiamine-phosphate pyrophosphorylase